MPGAPTTSVLASSAASCRDAVERQSYLTINDSEVASVAASLQRDEVLAACSSARLPVRFDGIQAEVNFHALMHLFDFGSGYDELLMAKTERVAHETAQYGCLGMHLQCERVDASLLKGFSHFHVMNYFGIDTHQEQEVSPGITMSRPGPLAQYVSLLMHCARNAGEALDAAGQPDLGALVLSCLERSGRGGGEGAQAAGTAAALVGMLCDKMAGFEDTGTADAVQVVFARKAQLLAQALNLRFGGEDTRFAFPDAAALGPDSGPVLPAVLRALGVLALGPELAAVVDGGRDMEPGPMECALRAAAVEATARIAAACPHGLSPAQIGAYLVSLGEPGGPHAQAPRHRCKATLAY